MKAGGSAKHEGLKGSAEEKALLERSSKTRVQSLRHEIGEMQQKRDAARSTLNGMVEAPQMEVTL